MLQLRLANFQDCRKLWEWRNETNTRNSSFNIDLISYDDHKAWFSTRIKDPDTPIFIVEDSDGLRVGYVRFDIVGSDADTSVSIDENHRGKGYGSKAIQLGCRNVLQDWRVSQVKALVKVNNMSSFYAFKKAGFKLAETGVISEVETYIMTLTAEDLS